MQEDVCIFAVDFLQRSRCAPLLALAGQLARAITGLLHRSSLSVWKCETSRVIQTEAERRRREAGVQQAI